MQTGAYSSTDKPALNITGQQYDLIEDKLKSLFRVRRQNRHRERYMSTFRKTGVGAVVAVGAGRRRNAEGPR